MHRVVNVYNVSDERCVFLERRLKVYLEQTRNRSPIDAVGVERRLNVRLTSRSRSSRLLRQNCLARTHRLISQSRNAKHTAEKYVSSVRRSRSAFAPHPSLSRQDQRRSTVSQPSSGFTLRRPSHPTSFYQRRDHRVASSNAVLRLISASSSLTWAHSSLAACSLAENACDSAQAWTSSRPVAGDFGENGLKKEDNLFEISEEMSAEDSRDWFSGRGRSVGGERLISVSSMLEPSCG